MSPCKKCGGERTPRRICKPCANLHKRTRYANEAAFAEAVKEASRKARERDPLKTKRVQKRSDIKRRYGVPLEQVEALETLQQNKCACCQREFVEGLRSALRRVIDHDHSTGALRGLLCQGCNIGLGAFGDSEARLLAAIDYLHRSKL